MNVDTESAAGIAYAEVARAHLNTPRGRDAGMAGCNARKRPKAISGNIVEGADDAVRPPGLRPDGVRRAIATHASREPNDRTGCAGRA